MESSTHLQFKIELAHLLELWRNFCEKHTELYELTCDEYMHLLSSDIDLIEETLEKKTQTIAYINSLETRRNEMTLKIAKHLSIEKPKKITDLIIILNERNEGGVAIQIEKLNLILLDIIEKIQSQNKKNQFFLNKAILSLNELKESFTGKTNYKTYSSTGMSKSNNAY